jgi:hypothetical protein
MGSWWGHLCFWGGSCVCQAVVQSSLLEFLLLESGKITYSRAGSGKWIVVIVTLPSRPIRLEAIMSC